jgi:hypothetical protein
MKQGQAWPERYEAMVSAAATEYQRKCRLHPRLGLYYKPRKETLRVFPEHPMNAELEFAGEIPRGANRMLARAWIWHTCRKLPVLCMREVSQ